MEWLQCGAKGPEQYRLLGRDEVYFDTHIQNFSKEPAASTFMVNPADRMKVWNPAVGKD
jgi:hypothetical protein